MAKNMHGYEIVVNADKSDWGIKWGLAPVGDSRCWCYECSMSCPTTGAVDFGDSSALEVGQHPEVLSAGQADTIPAPNH